eukprot:162042-Prymnesium_polylepis.1
MAPVRRQHMSATPPAASCGLRGQTTETSCPSPSPAHYWERSRAYGAAARTPSTRTLPPAVRPDSLTASSGWSAQPSSGDHDTSLGATRHPVPRQRRRRPPASQAAGLRSSLRGGHATTARTSWARKRQNRAAGRLGCCRAGTRSQLTRSEGEAYAVSLNRQRARGHAGRISCRWWRAASRTAGARPHRL